MKKLLPLAVILCVSAAMPAMAKDVEGKGDQFFQKIDKNGDGVINRSEHDAFSRKMFEEADANKDKVVSQDELRSQKRREYSKHHAYREDMSPSAGRGYSYGDRSNHDFVPRSGGSAQDRMAYDEGYSDRAEWYGRDYQPRQ